MIPVERLLYKIDFKLNKIATLAHQEIPLENKLLALNEAQIALIKSKMGTKNTYSLGFDSFKKRYEDLQNLVEVPNAHALGITLTDVNLNKWSANLKVLDPKYMFYIDSYALATKGGCKGHIIYVNHDLTKHSDVSTLTANNHYRPSFEYQETFDTISGSQLELYTDGSFTYDKVYVSYLRYPAVIDQVGYTRFNNTPSVKQDCELKELLEDELINFTILELGYDTDNQQVAADTKDRIQKDE